MNVVTTAGVFMQLEILKSTISDNWFYLVHDNETATLIDPVDAATAIAAVNESGVRLEWVVNTHFHPDHTGGNDAVFEAFPSAQLCAGPDHSMIGGRRSVDRVLGHGDELNVGSVRFEILETPGHTAGHISLQVDEHLFSGDTVFVGGAGNCRFGGDPSVLFRTFRDVISALPAHTVFYPGHDYARRNIEFALSLQPEQADAKEMLGEVERHDGGVFLTTLEIERRYNPFFRSADPALQDAVKSQHADLWREERTQSEDDAEATFRSIRALRNNW